MPSYTLKNLKEIPDAAESFGLSPDLEARFARDALGADNFAVSYQRLGPNFRMPFGHKHEEQEELYVVVSGGGRLKLGDEVLEVRQWDAVRVPKDTMRAFEAGGTDTADPFGGSYFIEALTTELEERAWELIERIDELGGSVEAIEQGFVQREIEDAAFRYQESVERGERVIVGVNRYTENQAEPIELHHLDPEAERRQLERTARVRAERDADEAERALAEVRRVARGDENLLVPMRAALGARCTIGEICDVLRGEFGTYDAQRA